MFTGLIEQIGILKRRMPNRLSILPSRPFQNLVHGESVAVNGCCLTVEKEGASGEVEFFTLAETLKRTNLGKLPLGSKVNLERALRLGDRLGGHIVSGHIDGIGKILERGENSAGDLVFRVELREDLAAEVVEKGSIAIDGISLTVVEVVPGSFTVHLIPVTQSETALTGRKAGEIVNLESDILGKYVRRQLAGLLPSASSRNRAKENVTMGMLAEAGFL